MTNAGRQKPALKTIAGVGRLISMHRICPYWADVGVIRLCARKHRAVFVFNAVSEHPPTFLRWVLFCVKTEGSGNEY